jgi:hypoxanthine-guanine phosphoribosyltransferase
MDIHQKVKIIRQQNFGGKYFFNSLDDMFKNKDIVNQLKKMLTEYQYKNGPTLLIGSGKFARYINANGIHLDIIVTGGWVSSSIKRCLNKMTELSNRKALINGKKFILIDDSIYSGRTQNLISDHIKELGGKVIHTIVVYDGCKEKRDDISSMYRFFDHFIF